MEQAKKQWEKNNAEGRKIINDLITEDTERTVCRKHGTKIHRKERRKNDQSDI